MVIDLSLAFANVSVGDFTGASEHAGRALTLAEPVGQALAVAAIADFLVGRGLDQAKTERCLRLEDPYHQVPSMMRPSLIAGCPALFEGHLERCDRLLLPLREQILERGVESDLVGAACHLIWSACWRGDLARAEGYAIEAIDTAARIESDSLRGMALAFGAVSAAHAGEAAVTKTRAEKCIAPPFPAS